MDDYLLRAHAPGYESAVETGTVEASGRDEVIFRLEPVVRDDVVSIVDTVADVATGLALAGAEVDAVVGTVALDTTFTCAPGDYELLLPAGQSGSINITGSAPSFTGDSFNLESLAAGDIRTALVPQGTSDGSISGLVSDNAAEGAPLEGVRVTILPLGAALAFGTSTGADGRYSAPNLAARTPFSFRRYSTQAKASTEMWTCSEVKQRLTSPSARLPRHRQAARPPALVRERPSP